MSDKGDKICPLCTEEMDLTDQQLKPCKCGYEICVWCWNHIMEMAEKDNTEGRCPACRTPYDKEKIVAMATECERLVAELSSERKLKSQKMKPKVSDARMHLTNVRVVQRNLVYIIGLPLNLADETLLQKKEYFGQYGKVLKVSISRTATGAIQHASNNSCCVYITYAKEEEAVRCIQSVHSFVLEGRPLRACFGTTKYCHTWLKNTPCTIPDCLYLHDFGSPDDSFTKDDLDSAFTRSRSQQIIGATNNLHRRSGDVLPPPVDDYTNRNMSNAKSNSETINNGGIYEDEYFADSGVGKSNVLPAAASWVARASVTLPSVGSVSVSGLTSNNHQPEASNVPQVPLAEYVRHKRYVEGPTKSKGSGEACPANTTNDCSPHPSVSESRDIPAVAATSASSLKLSKPSRSPIPHELFHDDEDIRGLCSELMSVSINNNIKVRSSESLVSENLIQSNDLLGGQGSHQDASELFSKPLISKSSRESTIVDDLLGFCDQQPPPISSLPGSKLNLKETTDRSWQHDVRLRSTNDVHANVSPMNREAFTSTSSKPDWSNGLYTNHCTELGGNSSYSYTSSIVGPEKHLKEPSNASNVGTELALDTGENSIISNILSMDFEEWEDFSLTSLQSLVKLQHENEKQHSSLKIPSFRKAKENNQSRFSFAWQDDLEIEGSKVECSLGNQPDELGVSGNFIGNYNMHMDNYNDVSANAGAAKLNGFLGNGPLISSNSVSKPLASPPGFSVTSKPVPPGFPTHGTVLLPFDQSDHLLQNSVSQFGIPSSSKSVEFTNPATVGLGKGNLTTRLINPGFDVRPAIPSELSPLDHDAELQMLMWQSMSPPQNQNSFPSHFRNMFSSPADSYSISPRLGQFPMNHPSMLPERQQFGNFNIPSGHWGGWNEVKSPNYPNGQMGFSKFIPNYDDMKYKISGSTNNLYGRGFAM